MLYFSKSKIFVIYLFISIFSFFFFLNFVNFEDSKFLSKKINLGLDLRGDSYLLLEIDTNPLILQKLQNKMLSLRKILKEKKIKYKNLKINKSKITFQIEEGKADEFIKFFESDDNSINGYNKKFKSYELEIFLNSKIIEIAYTKLGIVALNNAALDQSLEIVRRRIDDTGVKEPTILKRGSNRILIELPGLDEPNRIKKILGKTANLNFRFVSDESESDFGTELLPMEENDNKVSVSKRVIISGENLIDAQPKFDNNTNEAVVTFSLNRVGSKRFGKATTNNVGKKLAIILDDFIISAPVIREGIVGGSGQISGDFTFQQATDLALLLRSGALPAPLNIIEERTVGPDLGEDSIKAGTISLIIGFILVISFMLFKYRILGIVANCALIVNLFLLMGFLTLVEATLTLPGIAGIILTIGMAVDANVLIFERIKEESKTEKSAIHAFDIGYKKAQSAIIDANITTLISALILFILGSGPVKGFALTLTIGIITTLFSVYFFARHLTSIYVKTYKNKKAST